MAAAQAHGLQYLTVQDMLWLHLQVAGTSMPFPFAKLEEATFTQFAYGTSSNALKQAAKFLVGFAKIAPFGTLDTAVAYLGMRAFLELNGYMLNLPDAEAASWVRRGLTGEHNIEEALSKLATLGAAHTDHDEVLQSVVDDSPQAIASLKS